MYAHNLFPFPDLKTVDMGGGSRYYKTPDGKLYPSVTTVLGSGDKSALLAWKARVGEEEAKRVSRLASSRGTKLHKLVEQHVNNEPFTSQDGYINSLFIPVKNFLQQNLTEVRALESAVFSHKLQVAGRTDLVGVLDGELNIIDIKTSNKRKKEEWIKNYLMQCAAYAYCIYEMTGVKINRYTIIMTVDSENDIDIFKGRCSDHLADFWKLRKAYDAQNIAAAS